MTIYFSPDDGISGQKCRVKFFYLIQYHLQIPLIIPIIFRVFSTIYKNRLIFNLAYLILLTVMMVCAKKEGFTKHLIKVLSNTIAIKTLQGYKSEFLRRQNSLARQKAGGKKNTPTHSLRHLFVTYPREREIDLKHTHSLSGNKSSRATGIYTHVGTKNLSAIKNPLDGFLTGGECDHENKDSTQ